jgi:predicted small secreted protein
MASNIKLKKSSVVGKIPTTGDLEYGEVALNFADGKLYYKTASNTIDFFTSDSTSSAYGDADVEALVDSAYINLRSDGPTAAEVSSLMDAIDNNIIPALDAIYDLGDSNNRFRDLYLSDSSIIFGETAFINAAKINLIPPVLLDSAIIKNMFSAGGDLNYDSTTGQFSVTVGAGGGLDSAAVISLVDSAYVQLRQSSVGSGGLDSALTNTLIDAKVQVLDIADIVGAAGNSGQYLKSLGNGNAEWATISTGLDSSLTTQLIDSAYIQLRQSSVGTGGLDSALVTQLVDSSYVQLRQDFAYGSLTGAPSNVSVFLNDANYLDSTTVQGVIDATYIQSNQTTYSNVSEFTNDANYLDSTTVQGVIDATYIQANQTTYNVLDSENVRNIFSGGTGVTYNSTSGEFSIGQAIGTSDSVTFAGLTISGNLTVNGTTTTVNTETINLADNLIRINSNEAGTPSENGGIEIERGTSTNVAVLWNETTDRWTFSNDGSTYHNLLTSGEFLDSTTVTGVIDATYIQANQTTYTNVSEFTNDANYLDSTTVQGVIDASYIQTNQTKYNTSDFTDSAFVTGLPISTFTNDANYLDSTTVQGVIDATYIQNNQTKYNTSDFTDSAFVTGLPVSTFTNDANYLDSTTATQLIDSAYIQLRQSSVGTGGLDSAAVISLVDSAYVQLRQSSVGSGGLDSAATNTLIDAKVQVLDIADIVGAAGNSGQYLKSLGNGNSTWATITTGLDSSGVTTLIDSAYIQLRQSSVGSGGLDSALVTQLIDSSYVQLRQDFAYSSLSGAPTALSSFTNDTNYLDSTTVQGVINPSYIQSNQTTYNTSDFTDSAFVTGLPVSTFTNDANYLDSTTVQGVINSSYIQANQTTYTNVSEFTNDANYLDSTTVTGVIDATYIQTNQTKYNTSDFTDSSFVTGLPISTFTNDANYLDSTTATQLIDSAYIQLRQSSVGSGGLDSAAVISLVDSAYVQLRQSSVGSGGLDSAATNTLIDAKVQVLDIADIVGAAGNSGEYLQSQGNGNSVWRAGKILNNWEEISTATYTASIGDRLIVDTTSAVTITLPSSASFGDEIVIIDGTGNADSNNITIDRNGHNIQSFDSDFIIDIGRAVTGLVYYNATQGWILTET